MKNLSDTYIQYGVSNEIAFELEKKELSVSTFKATSSKKLIEKYELESTIVEFVKDCLKRKPIEEDVIQALLERSNFICCVCKGEKSDAYIIHHIVEYSISQDNSYDNLAVLCPSDHDLAHRKGIALTNKLTEKQIRETKKNWEYEVDKHNSERAKQSKSELVRIDKSKIEFTTVVIKDNNAQNVDCNHKITPHTKFILRVTQTSKEQEFVTYLSVRTDVKDKKWIGFGTPLALKNVYPSERVYRVGRPGEINYEIMEYVVERINESGLTFNGNPILIDMVRFWGWHNNTNPLKFEFALID